MNTPQEPNTPEVRSQVDERRRRFTKGGLAGPIVFGTLLSRPVLGAAPHNCTISGQLSGNVSTHLQGTCSTLGKAPDDYNNPRQWPNADQDFLDGNTIRPFKDTPYSLSPLARFKDAFERVDTSQTPNVIGVATVEDVLKGDWDQNPNNNLKLLRVKLGLIYDTTNGIALGQEAVAAYMNAVDGTNGYPNFPITGLTVVNMFNAVIVSGGIYDPTGVNWNATQVLAYWRSLHP